MFVYVDYVDRLYMDTCVYICGYILINYMFLADSTDVSFQLWYIRYDFGLENQLKVSCDNINETIRCDNSLYI